MPTSAQHKKLTKWFFLAAAAAILYLFWHIIEPFALVLLTAGIAAIVLSPIQERLEKYVKYKPLAASIVILGVCLIVVIPLIILGLLMVEQAQTLLNGIGQHEFFQTFDVSTLPLYQQIPNFVLEELQQVNPTEIGATIAGWVARNIGTLLAGGIAVVFNFFIFFISLYYLLVDRHKIKQQAVELSPFQDTLDRKIADRMMSTVRYVVFGALIVAVVQGVMAAIGMTIFGVPGALIWGALTAVAAEVPIVGVGLILVPAILYLFFTGDTAGAMGLLIWSVVVVGLVDNILSPLLIKGKTHMHALLILVAILGGLDLFGPIGFVIGPTILAAVMVVIELYKSGILEGKMKA